MLLKSIFFLCMSLLFPVMIYGQELLLGQIIDQNTGKPIENASIYYNQTQIGTKSTLDGKFSLRRDNRFTDLIISCLGYEKIKITKIPNERLNILMKPINNTLSEIVVTVKAPGWSKWGKLFTKLLMSDNPKDYYTLKYKDKVILNPEVISFYFNQKTGILNASSKEPIMVINDKLGYLIRVDLEKFTYNITTGLLIYQSSLFFEQTKSSLTLNQIQKATNEVYYGSATHFLSSLAKNKLSEEGFEIQKVHEIKNSSKAKAIKHINNLKNTRFKSNGFLMDIELNDIFRNKDSVAYYRSKLSEPDTFGRIVSEINLSSILRYDENNKRHQLKFQDSLLVTYNIDEKKNLTHIPFFNKKINTPEKLKVETIIYQITNNTIFIYNTGEIENFNLYMLGYMGDKRLSASLPDDYDPSIPRVKVAYDALEKLRVARDENP